MINVIHQAKQRERLRHALLGLLGLIGVGCQLPPPIHPPTAIALSPHAERLYLAEGPTLWSLSLRSARGPALDDGGALPGPCKYYVDLDHWEGELFVLCSDGRVFGLREPERGTDLDSSAWRSVGESAALPAPVVALQRSDSALHAVAADGTLHTVVAYGDGPHEFADTLDRFRGPRRGGPGQLGIASFSPFSPWSVHAMALARGPEVVVHSELSTLSCSVWQRGAVLTDLALADRDGQTAAAVFVGPRGRTRLIHIHQGWGFRVREGVFDPHGGRRLAILVTCRWL